MEALWAKGARIRAFDPEAQDECRRIYGERDDLQLCADPMEALEDANALIVVTEWNVFRSPDFFEIKSKLEDPVIFDGRNMYEPKLLAEMGYRYYAIGRGDRAP